MKDSLSIVVMDESKLNSLKKRIHNQRKVINRQKDDVADLKQHNEVLTDGLQNAISDNADYEDTIKGLAVKYNKLVKEHEDLQKLEVKHKRQLIAVKHALHGKLNVALR